MREAYKPANNKYRDMSAAVTLKSMFQLKYYLFSLRILINADKTSRFQVSKSRRDFLRQRFCFDFERLAVGRRGRNFSYSLFPSILCDG